MANINIQSIKETQYLLQNKVDLSFKRFIFNEIDFSQRLIGIVGPRGVGKTTLILQHLKENHPQNESALYLLADLVLFQKGDLLDFAREFHLKHGGELICIDEIHRYENWQQELKNIYDSLPDLKIIFSGSSSLNLIKGKSDLSRRGIIYKLNGLSFREYLQFNHNIKTKAFSLKRIIADYQKISYELMKHKNILQFFNEYLEQGYYPFFKETKNAQLYFQQINNTIDKTIYEDIASFYNLKTKNLVAFRQMLNFLATAKPGKINVNKLANSLNKNYATASQYLQILQDTSLVRFLANDRAGHALVRKAKKVFLDNTNLLQALNKALGKSAQEGTKRELFTLNQLQNAGYVPCFTEKGDLTVDNYTFEIGGKNKTPEQIKGIENSYLVLDDILAASRGKIPIWLFGFLY